MAERPIHLVGGVPLEARDVFELAGASFGSLAKRLPDGEKKRGWLRPQAPIIGRAPGMIPGGVARYLHMTNQRYRPAPGQDLDKIEFGPLGYLTAARESYAVFGAARAAEKIAPGTRFQISVPTAFGVMGHCIDPDAVRDMWPVYERQLFAEINAIAREIPPDELAVQWDIAVEITQSLDNAKGSMRAFEMEELAASITRALDSLPDAVEGGLHLCYGDAGEDKHYVNPRDTGVMVAFHNAIAARAKHAIAWVHMPVPKERDDEAYYAPLADLRLRPETELMLGLVHRRDGIDGAKRKLAAARKFAPTFGIGTECGMGRYFAPETMPEIFALHRQVAAAS
ncbi:MAG TPA: hypothetical protein VG328_20740 [Stellaceae bacterium]|jgi:hypothetical protein|nr:hypothetical protein [Stellaceae bacterium]